MTKCIVKGCSNTTGKNSGVKLHGFPNSLALIKLWLEQIGDSVGDVDALAQRILDSRKRWIFRICSAHFSPQNYVWDGKKSILRADAVPTIFPGKKKSEAAATTSGNKTGRRHPKLQPVAHAQTGTNASTGRGHSRLSCHSGRATKDAYTSTHNKMVDASTSTDPQCNKVDKGVQWPEFEFNFNGEPWKVQLDHFYPSSGATHVKTTKKCKAPAPNPEPPPGADSSALLERHEAPRPWQSSQTRKTLPPNKTTRFNAKSQPYGSMATVSDASAEREISESDLASERKFIVFESCLDDLLYKATCRHGDGCTARIRKLEKHVNGTSLSVTGHCLSGHRSHLWHSQPTTGDIAAGNVLTAAAVLFSGSSFRQLQEMSHLLGLQQISLSAYQKYQQEYLFPTVDLHWRQERLRLRDAFRNTQLTLAGDRRRDIPGDSLKCCVYTFIDVATSRIVDFQMEWASQSTLSADLEKRTFKNGLDRLLQDFEIKTVATDSHPGISKVMSRSYRHINHEFDIWQYARGVRRRLRAASRRKSCRELGQWVPAVSDHLWWCASTSQGKEDMLRERWQSTLFHVTDQHEWEGASLYPSCAHKPLKAEQRSVRPWLRPGSPSFNALREVVLDPRVTRDLSRLSQFCHTREIEIYHSFMQKFLCKKNPFTADATDVRAKLAALAYNANVHKRRTHIKHSRRKTGARPRRWELAGSGNTLMKTLSEHVPPMMIDALKMCSSRRSQGWRSHPAAAELGTETQPVNVVTSPHGHSGLPGEWEMPGVGYAC
ncbi:uncharacterized protein LOC128496430 [Spea bombifrons]|uniref:uncharacterized protein LOC128496430 n=1 Tax=Spea bombifrons TaxID=233779 RepID=UPI00234A98E9|nr:uncharacterized protein LOC128496430 [Spea bombifrons]